MTKNMPKIAKSLVLALLAAVALRAMPARAFNLNDATMAQLDESYDSEYTTMLSTTPASGNEQTAFKLYYTGTSSEAVVTVGSTGITFQAPFGTNDPTFPSGLVSATTYPTVGQMCDAINATGGKYQCRLEDARRSDLPATLLGTTAASGVNNLKAIGGFAVAFTNASNSTTSAPYFLSMGINPPAGRRAILKKCTFYGAASAAGTVQFSITGVKRSFENSVDGVTRNDSTLVWLSSAPANTATTLSFDDAGVGGISFAAGLVGIPGPSTGLPGSPTTVQPYPSNPAGRFVVRIATDISTTIMNSADYLYCEWLTRSTGN